MKLLQIYENKTGLYYVFSIKIQLNNRITNPTHVNLFWGNVFTNFLLLNCNDLVPVGLLSTVTMLPYEITKWNWRVLKQNEARPEISISTGGWNDTWKRLKEEKIWLAKREMRWEAKENTHSCPLKKQLNHHEPNTSKTILKVMKRLWFSQRTKARLRNDKTRIIYIINHTFLVMNIFNRILIAFPLAYWNGKVN